MNVEKDVEHPDELRRNEPEDEQEEALTVGHLEECWLQCGTGSQFRTDLCLEYRYVGNQTDEHY